MLIKYTTTNNIDYCEDKRINYTNRNNLQYHNIVRILHKEYNLRKLTQEIIVVVSYKGNTPLACCQIVSKDSQSTLCKFNTFDVYSFLLNQKKQADSYLLVHNHPHGILQQSEEDASILEIFKNIDNKLFNNVITIKDFLIITPSGEYERVKL